MYGHRDRASRVAWAVPWPVIAAAGVLAALWLVGFAAGYGSVVPAWAVVVPPAVAVGAVCAGLLLVRGSHGGVRDERLARFPATQLYGWRPDAHADDLSIEPLYGGVIPQPAVDGDRCVLCRPGVGAGTGTAAVRSPDRGAAAVGVTAGGAPREPRDTPGAGVRFGSAAK